MVQMLVHHKWFIRAGLAIFWAIEIIANAYGYGFLTPIATHQPIIMVIIVFISIKYLVEWIYAPFVKITTDGGETMDKSTWVMRGIVALAIAFGILMLWDVSRNFIVQTFFIDTVLSNIYLAILGFEAWAWTYSPLWVIFATFIGTLILAIALNTYVRPKMPWGSQVPKALTHEVQKSPREPEAPPIAAKTSQPEETPLTEKMET